MWDSRGITVLYLEVDVSSGVVVNTLTKKVSEDLDKQVQGGQETIAWIPQGVSDQDIALITAAPELLKALKNLAFVTSDNKDDYPDWKSYEIVKASSDRAMKLIESIETPMTKRERLEKKIKEATQRLDDKEACKNDYDAWVKNLQRNVEELEKLVMELASLK